MFYNDHAPPHFHVRYGSQRAIVDIDTLSVLEGSLSPRVLGRSWNGRRSTSPSFGELGPGTPPCALTPISPLE